MAFGFIAGAAITTVAAVLVTGHRVVGIRRMVKHATLVDVVFTVGMAIAFAGTLTGLLVAIVAGLVMALVLSGAQKLQTLYERRMASTGDEEFNANGWVYNQAPYV